MKMFTNNEQTARLIALGFKKPGPNFYLNGVTWMQCRGNYSIGELMTILPQTINDYYDLSILRTHKGWWVLYGIIGDCDMWSIEYEVHENELIDALYEMVVKLKEENKI